MSSYHGNHKRCPHCKTTYRQFKTGLTYNEVFQWFWSVDDDSGTWRYKRRRTVLGAWHAHKKDLFEHHVREGCPELREESDAAEPIGAHNVAVEGVPF